MNLITISILILSIFSFILFSFSIYQEYIKTFPFCSEEDISDLCTPCPENAKCIETEIKCDERYYYQDGQCLPFDVSHDNRDLITNHIRNNSKSKKVFLITFEIIEFSSIVIFIIVNIHQFNIKKEE